MALLLTLGVVAALGASVAVWLDRQAVSNRGWAETSPHLIANRTIRAAVGSFAVEQLFAQTPVAGVLGKTLPAGLARPLLAQLRALGRHLSATILSSHAARAVWTTANRRAHRQLLGILDHGGRRGEVSLDLTVLLRQLVGSLLSSGPLEAIPGAGEQLFTLSSSHPGEIPILSAGQVTRARGAVNAIRGSAVGLSLAAVTLFALAVLAAGGWRAVAVAAVGGCLIAVGGLVLLARLVIAPVLADALVSSSTYRPAAKAAWMIATTELRQTAVWLLVAGGVLLVTGLGGRALRSRPAQPA